MSVKHIFTTENQFYITSIFYLKFPSSTSDIKSAKYADPPELPMVYIRIACIKVAKIVIKQRLLLFAQFCYVTYNKLITHDFPFFPLLLSEQEP